MPLFNYTQTQEMAQVTPVSYNVQPNLSLARAVSKLQEAVSTGIQISGQMSQQKHEENLLKMQEDQGVFNSAWEASDFNNRLNLMGQLQSDLSQSSNPKNKFERDLYQKKLTFFNGYDAAAAKEGIVDRHRDNEVMLLQNMAAFQQEFISAGSIEDRQKLLENFDTQFTDPYKNNSDQYSQSLLTSALDFKNKLNTSITQERIGIKDNNISVEASENIATWVGLTGNVTSAQWTDTLKKMSGLSSWQTESGKLTNGLVEVALSSFRARISNLDQDPKTKNWESALEAEKQIKAFYALDPKISGKDSARLLNDTLASFKTSITSADKDILVALLNNDSVDVKTFNAKNKSLLDRGSISEEVYNYNSETKIAKLKETTLKGQANSAYLAAQDSNDFSGLTAMVAAGNGSSVSAVISGQLEKNLFARLEAANQNQQDPSQAFKDYFAERNMFASKGLPLKDSPFITDGLNAVKDGKVQTTEDVAAFVGLYSAALASGSKIDGLTSVNSASYYAMKTLLTLGVPEPAKFLTEAAVNKKTIKDGEVQETFDSVLGLKGFIYDTKMNPTSERLLKQYLDPTIRLFLKSGLDPMEIEKELKGAVADIFIPVDATLGWNSEGTFFLPKTATIPDNNAYQNVLAALSFDMVETQQAPKGYGQPATTISTMKAGVINTISVMPVDIFNPDGDWIVFSSDTPELTRISNKDIKIMARTARPIAGAEFIDTLQGIFPQQTGN